MNILVIRFSSLGDLVTLEPTFRTVRHFFKNDSITFLTTNVGKGLYSDSNYFDEYIIHQSIFKSFKSLRNKTFDLVINLQCNKPSLYISFLINKNIVVNKSYSLIDKILNKKVLSKTTKELIESTGFFNKNKIDNYFNNQEYFIKDKIFIKLPLKKDKKFLELNSKKCIGISIGSSERWLSKKWGLNNYSLLIKNLIIKGYRIVLVGSKLELEESQFLLNKFSSEDVLSYVNKTNLTELKILLSEVDLFIGNDSGPAHIAAGVGTNTITIFGSTGVKHCVKNIPYYGNHICIKPDKSISCHPCYKTKCPTNMECMENISIDHVLENINLIMKKELKR